ncbi:TPA_asm: P6 [Howea betacytorhabdovirus 1]|nr:TPA_asm: P6 [Howea betacytorhabdovirus 1]
MNSEVICRIFNLISGTNEPVRELCQTAVIVLVIIIFKVIFILRCLKRLKRFRWFRTRQTAERRYRYNHV